jgi:hypothetical protein
MPDSARKGQLLLEGPLLDRFVDLLFAALLVTFFLPLLGWYSILAGWDSVRAGLNRRKVSGVELFKQQIAGEFNFERAIEAYEELIDSTFAEGRL